MDWISPRKLKKLGILNMNRRNVDYISRYNERESYPLVDNKLKTKLAVSEYGVKTPELLQVVRQQHEISHFREIAEGLAGFAIKPAKGSGGKGITVITGRDGDDYVKASGARISVAMLERHLTNILAGLYSLAGTPDVAIVEDLVQSTPSLARYSFQGVPDIRIIIFQGYPVMAMLRLATKDSDGKANLHQGAVGVGLDIGTGRSLNAVQFNRPITLHPDTGLALENIQIDSWEDMLEMASRCYEATGLGYMGVDLVVDTQKGPLLLELNARPGLAIQMANGEGLLPRLRNIEALKRPHFSPRERVQYAMGAFGKF
ncbi:MULTISPECIES: alpha-L-glutamate ligase-like protein [Marinobacter]|jgi:alpha-L-glutamate ligase-like protein|uniref:Alpha-L-glutamate ligase-like protein n=1 Tax=Marinobacter nauticus TaxID=2743 RepID=A0A455W8S5_MARNT|nr:MULTISPECIES: alpha-L-glutamate ligase-like protein [Marinobacter]WBU42510.1 alpha-L-glutamate ligase-like protein [Marinobacter alkaliphilus]BBJ03407.1 alpha-L-glutamate ligase-like protein [Marinobacter nauticus]MAO15047.1 alpha-L-glutamate ligase-like protein [Marinobacter sp.]PSF10866.1 alpha-L-glutamate ligase-like protein [Marinobacter shengliensis]BEH14010.1 alpha-L-glutamate ligase-like protein [Marinobacter shengliensis]|tara:strand:+ start:211 stop:1158 length:948 start_codon:yes stop_codon:yes gene_type:complete